MHYALNPKPNAECTNGKAQLALARRSWFVLLWVRILRILGHMGKFEAVC